MVFDMPYLPKIERRMIVVETGEGFLATYKWIHNPGLPWLEGIPEIEEINSMPIPDIDDGLIDDFPHEIPATTPLWKQVGTSDPYPWPCPQDAYLKSIDLTAAHGHDRDPVKATIKGEVALYSYTEEPTAEDPMRGEASNPWAHPVSGKVYQSKGGWPDISAVYPAYYRWVGVAQHYLSFEVDPPYHYFLAADTTDAMNLISYIQGGGCYVADWEQWIIYEGREPLVTFTNMLTSAGIPWRQTTQSGTRYIDIQVCVFPEDGTEDPGFYLPRNGVRAKPFGGPFFQIIPSLVFGFGMPFGFGLRFPEDNHE